MSRLFYQLSVLFCLVLSPFALFPQVIRSDYLDLSVPGQWESASKLSNGLAGTELYYDAKSGSLVEIRALPSMQKVTEISKYFQSTGQASSADPSQMLSAFAFPLPDQYAARSQRCGQR